tara:strand:- start:878 stop:1309 length:432 start_codon:yes stop_codon:yes gene_type:complete
MKRIIKKAKEYRYGGDIRTLKTDQLYDNEGTKKYQRGGIIGGPSHEEGGVKAKVKGSKEAIEVEGGEFIVNKESAKKHRKKLEEINNDKEATKKLKPVRQHGLARKGGNIAKNPETGKRKKVKHASNTYRKGGTVKYPGVGCD